MVVGGTVRIAVKVGFGEAVGVVEGSGIFWLISK